MATRAPTLKDLFPDPNLALTVLEAMRALGVAPEPPKIPEDASRLDLRVRRKLLATRLPPDVAARIEKLEWDGGNSVHHDVWPRWDGEDGTFDVTSLEGIGALTGLRSLTFRGGWRVDDCAPLAALSKLERFSLLGGALDVEALLGLPALQHFLLDAVQDAKSPENQQAIAALTARGVTVEVRGGGDRRKRPRVRGSRPLVEAVRRGNAATVEKLLAAGADPGSTDEESTALSHACFDGRIAIIDALLDAGADPNTADPRGYLPLAVAASKNRDEIVRRLVDRGAGLEGRSRAKGTALHAAAAQGADRAVAALVDRGASLEALDEFGAPPLHYAAMHGHKAVVLHMLEKGASLQAVDARGRTALHHTLRTMLRDRVDHWRSEGRIEEQPVAYEIRNGKMRFYREGREAWLSAAGEKLVSRRFMRKHLRYLELRATALALIKAGSDLRLADEEVEMPAHLAAGLGEGALFDEMRRRGAPLEARTKSGKTVLHEAVESGRPDFFDRAERLEGLDPSVADDSGLTPLHRAASDGTREIVEALLRLGPTEELREAVAAIARAHDHADLAERLAPPPPPDPRRRNAPDELAGALERGEIYLPALPNESRHREGFEPLVCVVDGTWIDAWFDPATGALGPERGVRPAAELREVLRGRAFGDGSCLVETRPMASLPPAVRDALAALVSSGRDAQAALQTGTHWVRHARYPLAFRRDPEHGWQSIKPEDPASATGALIAIVEPVASEVVAKVVTDPEYRIEPVPPAVLDRLRSIHERFAQLRRDFMDGRIGLVRPQYAARRLLMVRLGRVTLNAELDGDRLETGTRCLEPVVLRELWATASGAGLAVQSIEGGLVQSLRLIAAAAKPEPATLVAEARSGALEISLDVPGVFTWVRVHGDGARTLKDGEPIAEDQLIDLLTRGEPAKLRVEQPKQAPTGPDPSAADVALAARAAGLSPAALAGAVSQQPPPRQWRWPAEGGLTHEVSLWGYTVIWFTDGPLPVGARRERPQPIVDFLRDGHTTGPRPPDAVLTELRIAVRKIVLTALANP
ncbi:MAG: ankyrin repeat domain-containing protein [Deltaproteobacteria bacterium]|nr:ankyrin repeat domain-containing protein [Deltaproteobacteria bacterium]